MPPAKHPIGFTRTKILENLASQNPKPWKDLAVDLGIKPSSIYVAILKMKAAGHLTTGPISGTTLPGRPLEHPAKPGPKPKPKTEEAELASISEITDPITRRAKLDRLINTGQPGIALRAIQIREDLDRFSGVRVGPPVPATHAETITRLGTILKAAGPKLTKEAIEWVAEQNHKKEEPIAEDQNPPETVSPEPSTGRSDLVG